jgi:hypothetical protein
MSLFLPGALPRTIGRRSRLAYHWRAADATIDALSGHVGTFTVVPATPYTIEGRNGVAVGAGHGQPRFEQVASRGNVVRLVTENLAGSSVENLTYDFALNVQSISMCWRVFPVYAVGTNLASPVYGPMLGTDNIDGGLMTIGRNGTNWVGQRHLGASSPTATLSDVGLVYPVDLLFTYDNVAAQAQLWLRDSSPTPILRNSSLVTDSPDWLSVFPWGNSKLTLNGAGTISWPGGRWRHEYLKVARGIHTFASIDLLS